MNHTPQRTRRKTTKRKQQRRKPLRGRFALLGAAVLLVLLLLRCGADEPQPGSAAADETAGETTAETQPVPATQAADPPSKDDPLLLLVSRAQPLAEDYAPELTQLHDWPYSIAAIAYEPLRQMLAAGRAEGLSFTLYTGMTDDPERRLAAHRSGHGAKYTRGRGPLELVYSEACGTRGDALRREAAIKRLPRAKKLRLIKEVL